MPCKRRRNCLCHRGEHLVVLLLIVLCQQIADASATTATATATESLPVVAVAEDDESTSAAMQEHADLEGSAHDQEQDQERDDRTWLDVFGEAAKEFLTTQLIPPTDANCRWDWRLARCEPFCQCAWLPAWGDYHLGRSCRLRPATISSTDKAVCAPREILTFDHLRMEYEETPQLATLSDIPPRKQILFRTVQALQTTWVQLQKWAILLQHETRKRYENLQETTCAQSCSYPPSPWTLPNTLLCQGWNNLHCPKDEMETSDSNKNHKWGLDIITKSWKQLWNMLEYSNPTDNDDDDNNVHDFSHYYSGANENRKHATASFLSSLSLPEWSTASDWSAGIATPKPKPTRQYRQHPPPPPPSADSDNSKVVDKKQKEEEEEEEPFLAESQDQQQPAAVHTDSPMDLSEEHMVNSKGPDFYNSEHNQMSMNPLY